MRDLLPNVDWPRASAWILYDTANTVYTATIAFLFAPFVAETFADRSALGATQTVSMILAGLSVPVLGALADRTRFARSLLWISTLASVGLIATFGQFQSKWALLGAFFCANFAFQSALVFYNALLPSVAPMRRTGLISGLGVGFGFGGTVLTLAFVPGFSAEPANRFLLASGMFLVMALPCLWCVRDRRDLPQARIDSQLIGSALRDVRQTLIGLRSNRPLLLFLIGNFCLTDVLLTATLWFADYTRQTFDPIWRSGGLELFGRTYAFDAERTTTLNGFIATLGLALNGSALIFGSLQGALADRFHPLQVLRVTGVMLLLALIAGGLFAGDRPEAYFFGMVIGGAFGMAGVQTAGRKLLLLMIPREKIGEYFGLYGITTKVSVIGSLTFGVLADSYGLRTALFAQSVQAILGLTCLFMIRVDRIGRS
ncbi:MAG: MFS transporter [Planctomycetota bacterium]